MVVWEQSCAFFYYFLASLLNGLVLAFVLRRPGFPSCRQVLAIQPLIWFYSAEGVWAGNTVKFDVQHGGVCVWTSHCSPSLPGRFMRSDMESKGWEHRILPTCTRMCSFNLLFCLLTFEAGYIILMHCQQIMKHPALNSCYAKCKVMVRRLLYSQCRVLSQELSRRSVIFYYSFPQSAPRDNGLSHEQILYVVWHLLTECSSAAFNPCVYICACYLLLSEWVCTIH